MPLNFFFFPLVEITTPQLKSEKSSRKFRIASKHESLDSTDRNYFVKLWAKLSCKKTPVVRMDEEGEAVTERYTVRIKRGFDILRLSFPDWCQLKPSLPSPLLHLSK